MQCLLRAVDEPDGPGEGRSALEEQSRMPVGQPVVERVEHEDHFRKAYLLPALQARLIEMTIPDKPRSRNQRYRLTPAGCEYLRQIQESQ